jgi:hypothetical protein
LLPLFGVNNAPRSWYHLKRLIITTVPSHSCLFECPNCSSASTNSSNCSTCGHHFSSDLCLNNFIYISIKDQLEIILNNNAIIDFFPRRVGNILSDIRDGNVYQQLKLAYRDRFLTFTINVDGVEIKNGSNKSIWPDLLVINELPLSQRYALENTIIAGIWSSPQKPTRIQMSGFLSPIVEELSEFEQEYIFVDYRRLLNEQNTVMKVFLIAACCDKPAQALVQNIADPIAPFGCGRCELLGKVQEFFDVVYDRLLRFHIEKSILISFFAKSIIID